MPEIGETLRDARMRARIDVSEIEARTKIRAKYLRALENEEWGLLPGPTFVKSFLRTYAQALDLDAKALVEEYRANHEPPGEGVLEPVVSSPQRPPRAGRGQLRPSRWYLAVVAAVSLVIVLLIVGLLSGGGSSGGKGGAHAGVAGGATAAGRGSSRPTHVDEATASKGLSSATTPVSLSLRSTGTVFVCLLGEHGRRLIDGKTLEAGEKTATFTAARFELTLGNNAVTLLIDGTPRKIPASSQAIGYSITKAGRRVLKAGRLPSCP
jgi:transcriptional regulator with XRE-family HTH domain